MFRIIKSVIILIVLLFATSIIMGNVLAGFIANNKLDQAKDVVSEDSGELERLRNEIEFYKLLAESLKEKDSIKSREFEIKSQELEFEFYRTIDRLEGRIEDLKEKDGKTVLGSGIFY